MLPESQCQQQDRGFSLIEMLVVLVMSSVIITAIYQTFHSQQRSYQKQNTMAMMQQTLRASTYMLTRELRGAGYDPQQTGRFGIVTGLPFPFTIDYNTQTDIIAFLVDSDAVAPVGTVGVPDPLQTERIAYRFNAAAHTLDRFNIQSANNPAGEWEPVTDQVDAVNFVYYDANGVRTRIPQNIRSIAVSLLIRSGKKELTSPDTNTYLNKEGENIRLPYCSPTIPDPYPYCTPPHYRRQLWTTIIQLRNTPLPS